MASFCLQHSRCCSFSHPFCSRHKKPKCPQVRSKSFRDDGRSANNIIDGNLSVLRERIAEVRMKDRLEKWSRSREEHGWNYRSGYDPKCKREAVLWEFLEIVGSISGALGLVFLSGSMCLCLASLIVYLCCST